MATTEVLLLEHIKTLGAEGELVKVKSGYARNFLFPRRKALLADRANKKQIEALIKARDLRKQKELLDAKAVAQQLASAAVVVVVKTGENGKIFGAVTPKEIADQLAKGGIEIDRKKIHIDAPIKEIGSHKFSVKLHPEVTCELAVEVVSENPIN